jgi:hypothetical protein
MAGMKKVNVRSFLDKYKDTVDQVKRNILNYVKGLQEAAGEREPENGEPEVTAEIKLTDVGIPIVPDPKTWCGHLKKEIEPLL